VKREDIVRGWSETATAKAKEKAMKDFA